MAKPAHTEGADILAKLVPSTTNVREGSDQTDKRFNLIEEAIGDPPIAIGEICIGFGEIVEK